MNRILRCLPAGLIIISTALLSVSSSASAAPAMRPATHEVFTTTGQIHPWGTAFKGKCLTTNDNPSNRSQIWWSPCLPAKSPFAVWQRFFAYRIIDPTQHIFNVGEISLAAHPDVSVCRYDSVANVVTCDTIHDPRSLATKSYDHASQGVDVNPH